jgi:pimeloyl-ACP methyl ester carboxylesterase
VPPVAPAAVGAQAAAAFAYYDDAEKLFAQLSTITAPVFIGAGDHDDAFPARDSTALLEQIPGAQLDVHPDSGHGFQLQYPEEFTRRVATLLDSPPVLAGF